MIAPLPENEADRLAALRRYRILDTAAEQWFDDLTLLAARICETPIALISLVDDDRQWFKSKLGVTVSETKRDVAFCAHGILQKDLFVIPDALRDDRFAANPLVLDDPKIRFYAGAPLTVADGLNVGMLCVIDRVPRQLPQEQLDALRALGRQVTALLDLRLSHAMLRESEQRWRLRTEHAYDLIAEISGAGQVLYASPSHFKVLGYHPSDLVGRDSLELVHPEDRPEVRQTLSRAVAARDHYIATARFRCADGTWRWIESAGQVFESSSGEERLTIIARDITDRRELEQQRADFAAMLSHDIRNPLFAVRGYCEILLGTDGMSPDAREVLARMMRSTDTILSLASNHLDASKIDAGQLAIVKRPVALNELLTHLTEQFEAEATRLGVRLACHLAPNLPPIGGDPVALERVFTNLIHNALKFTSRSGHVTVESNVTSSGVVVVVADSGLGIAPEELPRLFQRYRQTASGRARKGTGLGLFIVKTLVDAHDGTIGVDSSVGKGTRFTVALPLATAARSEGAEEPPRPAAAAL